MHTTVIAAALTAAIAAAGAVDPLEPPAPPVETVVDTAVETAPEADDPVEFTPEVVTPEAPTIVPVCAETFEDEPNVLAIEFDAYPADGYYFADGWDTDDVVTVTAHVTDPAAYAMAEDAVTAWTFDVAAMLPDCDTERHDEEEEPVVPSDSLAVDAAPEQDSPDVLEVDEPAAPAIDLGALHASVMYRVR